MATIRPATLADAPALSRICLLTGDAGGSAAPSHNFGELLGLVYAVNYVQGFPGTFGYVLDDPELGAVGYVLGTADTRAFEHALEKSWWPAQRARYPLPPPDDGTVLPADRRMIGLLHNPDTSPQEVLDACPAHIHIDILESHQRAGWGRKLIQAAADHLAGVGNKGLYVGIDPRNDKARQFYKRLGFKQFDIPSGAEFYTLSFEGQ